MSADLFGADGLDPNDIDRLAEALGAIEHAWEGTLAELVDVLTDTWHRKGRSEDEAAREARLVIKIVARHCGGRQFYLPVGEVLDRALRDAEIYHRWTRGESIRSLARAHKLTETRVYAVLARERKMRFERAQQRLPL
ncbi:MAG: hypothetical protein KDH15_12115 [Rhodocyclaceae bacterium]|nr:hypothetical protein [Rhodocyclaceae bacterium]